jgi:hypothetical protein
VIPRRGSDAPFAALAKKFFPERRRVSLANFRPRTLIARMTTVDVLDNKPQFSRMPRSVFTHAVAKPGPSRVSRRSGPETVSKPDAKPYESWGATT